MMGDCGAELYTVSGWPSLGWCATISLGQRPSRWWWAAFLMLVGDKKFYGGWPSWGWWLTNHGTSPGLNFVSQVSVPNLKSVVHFLLLDFGEDYLLLVVTGGKQSQLRVWLTWTVLSDWIGVWKNKFKDILYLIPWCPIDKCPSSKLVKPNWVSLNSGFTYHPPARASSKESKRICLILDCSQW